jgi:hypothetical protein
LHCHTGKLVEDIMWVLTVEVYASMMPVFGLNNFFDIFPETAFKKKLERPVKLQYHIPSKLF